MLTDDVVLALVGQIYDAALDPDLWSSFLSRLASVLAAGMAHFVCYDEAHDASAIGVSVGCDPEIQKTYATYYCAHDAWAAPARHRGLMRTGGAGVSQMLVPYSELVKSEFYDGYARPIGCVHGMTGMVLTSGTRNAGISLGRTDEKQPFGDAELMVLRELLPHLRRAYFIHSRIAGLTALNGPLEEVLGLVTAGVALVDVRGRVTWMNRRASEMVAGNDGLQCDDRSLRPVRPCEQRRWTELLKSALATRSGKLSRGGGMMTVSRPSGRPALVVTITPVSVPQQMFQLVPPPDEVPAAAVFLQNPDGIERGLEALLAMAYGLTPAEQRVALLLVSGRRPQEIADTLSLAVPTVRTHLRHIFAKTDTRSQADLVRLLMATTAVDSA